MNTQIRLRRMVRESFEVLMHPDVRTLNYYGARGSDGDALTYVAVGAFIVSLVSLLFGGGGNALGFIMAIINQLFEFYLFAGVIYFVGKQFGGIGDFEAVVYTFALFYVPILLLTWALTLGLLFVPGGANLFIWMTLAGMLARGVFAYLGVRAVLRLRRPRDALLTVGIGLLVIWVIQLAFSQSFGVI